MCELSPRWSVTSSCYLLALDAYTPSSFAPIQAFIVDFLSADAHAGRNKWCPTSTFSQRGAWKSWVICVSPKGSPFFFNIITNKHDLERVSTNVDSMLVINQYHTLSSEQSNFTFNSNSFKRDKTIASDCSMCDRYSAIIHVSLPICNLSHHTQEASHITPHLYARSRASLSQYWTKGRPPGADRP